MPGQCLDPNTINLMRRWLPSLEFERVRIVTGGPVCWFVRAVLRQGAMTLAPYIFYGRAHFDPANPRSMPLLAHELLHCRQAQGMGRLRFFVRYAWDLAKRGFRYSRELPLEAEAYALQAEVRAAMRPDQSAVV